MPRKFLILIFLLMILIFVILKIIPKLKTSGGYELEMDSVERKIEKKARIEYLEPPIVKISLLDENLKEKTFSIGRNIFRYAPPKTTLAQQNAIQNINRGDLKSPPKVVYEPLGTEQQTPSVPIERPQKKEPPSFTYKYLGFFGPQDKKIAVFSDGKEIMDIFEGETISDKFILRKIGFESVTIGFVDFPEDITQKIEVGP